MCSYNSINSVPACAHPWLLTSLVREFWGRPDATHTSDCGAVESMFTAKHWAASIAGACVRACVRARVRACVRLACVCGRACVLRVCVPACGRTRASNQTSDGSCASKRAGERASELASGLLCCGCAAAARRMQMLRRFVCSPASSFVDDAYGGKVQVLTGTHACAN